MKKKSILCARCRISIIRLVEKKFFPLNQKSFAIDSFFLTGQEKKEFILFLNTKWKRFCRTRSDQTSVFQHYVNTLM